MGVVPNPGPSTHFEDEYDIGALNASNLSAETPLGGER